MDCILYKNLSENNTIGKSLSTVRTISGIIIKGSISIYSPVLIVTYDSDDISNANYAYISEYNRYYFIDNIIPMTGNRYELHLKCDVLESFKNNIKKLKCIIDKQENYSISNGYINDGSHVLQSNEIKEIKNFPNGFNDEGNLILICAGGDGGDVDANY